MAKHSVGVWALVSAGLMTSWMALARAEQAAPWVDGRWAFQLESVAAPVVRPAGAGRAGAAAGGRGGRGTPAESARAQVIVSLRAGPANGLAGNVTTLAPGRGGGGAAGTQPVQISDGRFDGTTVAFEIWVLDGYRNRTRYEGRLDGEVLRLTLTREAPGGREVIAEVAAERLDY